MIMRFKVKLFNIFKEKSIKTKPLKNEWDKEIWHFTKENFREGIPYWIRDSGSISLWSQYGGRVIGGEIKCDGYDIDIREGNFIALSIKGEYYIC